jgi:hypothetical protein
MTPEQLAGIVARDADFVPQPDGSWTRFQVLVGEPPHLSWEAAISDRRALLALLRETREALQACHLAPDSAITSKPAITGLRELAAPLEALGDS